MPDIEELSMRQGLRILLFIGGLLFVLVGVFGLYTVSSLYVSATADSVFQLKTSKDHIFNLLWFVVMGCFVTTGYSLWSAAIRRRMKNIVPGPTLYIMGVSLVVIAMFLLSVGSLLSASFVGVVGFFVMWLEYRSAFI